MLNKKVHPDTWQVFFDRLSKALHATRKKKYAKLRLDMHEMTGTQDMAHWLPLMGITYDPNDSALYVILDGLTHRASQPSVIWASVASDGDVEAFLVLCRDGSRISIELSNHPFPHEASLYRRDPSSSFIRTGKDKAGALWNRLRLVFADRRRKDTDGPKRRRWANDKGAAAGLPDPGFSGQPLHPRAHRPSLGRVVTEEASPSNAALTRSATHG